MAAFGLVFGKFLASVGDETSGTTIINGLFNTVLNFSGKEEDSVRSPGANVYVPGLAVNPLLQKMSYRKVALIGSLLFFIGAFATIFVTSQLQMVVSFGIIQGSALHIIIQIRC